MGVTCLPCRSAAIRGDTNMNGGQRDELPKVEASLVIEGKNFKLEELTKELDILPTKTRGIDDWPRAIKDNRDLPEELRPRNVWRLSQTENSCRQIKAPIRRIMSLLKGKEQVLLDFCEKYGLRKVLCIVVHGESMNLPELVLSPDIVSCFGKLKVEIGFDLYAYE